MGVTISATLTYGYCLGGAEGEWMFREVYGEDEDGYGPKLDWYDKDGDDFEEQANARLIAAAGFTETDWRADGYWDRKRAVEKELGVQLERTGWEGGDLLLIVQQEKEFSAHVGDVADIAPEQLTAIGNAQADERLAAALRTLGITPNEEKAAWMLTVYYG